MTPAPLFADIAAGPADGSAVFLTTDDGVQIRAALFGRDAARNGTVLLLPGRTEYIEKYGMAADALAKRGFATAVVDWRGQGLSARLADDPTLGHVNRFVDFQRDLAAFDGFVRAQDLPGPRFLLAHSMGGAIGLRAVMEGFDVAAVAFSAPMWGIQMPTHKRVLASVIPPLAIALGLGERRTPGTEAGIYHDTAAYAGNVLTTDPEMYAHMQAQTRAHPELAIGAPSMTWLHEALGELKTLSARAAPNLPCLTLLGTREKIVEPQAIVDRMAKWPNGAIISFPGCEHEIMMEAPAARTQFFDSVAGHFVAQV